MTSVSSLALKIEWQEGMFVFSTAVYLESICKKVLVNKYYYPRGSRKIQSVFVISSTLLQMPWPSLHPSAYSMFLIVDWMQSFLFVQVLLPDAKKTVLHLQRQLYFSCKESGVICKMLYIPLGQIAIYKLKTLWNSSAGGTRNEVAWEKLWRQVV